MVRVTTIDEAKDIRDKAEAVRVYVKSARMGLDIVNHAAYVKIRAEQRAGELLEVMDKHPGGRPSNKTTSKLQGVSLAELGVDYAQSHRWQAMAEVPVERVDELAKECTEAGEELGSAAVYRACRARL